MNKILLISAFAFTLMTGAAMAQSTIVGHLDNDGIAHMTVQASEATEVLNSAVNARTAQPTPLTDVTFSRMAKGEICLTGYQKDSQGNIVSGVRIQCYQDDANNLIVKPENKTERIYGRKFASTTTASE